jgi:DNA-binding NarL/FixJ family response regulator
VQGPSGSPLERPMAQSAASRPRVLLVHDVPLALRQLRRILEESAEIVGEAASVDGALEQVPRSRVDVIVASLDVPGGHTLTLARRVRALWPWVQVVVHAEEAEDDAVGRARMAGAAEVVTGPLRAHSWELPAAVGRAYVAGLSARW